VWCMTVWELNLRHLRAVAAIVRLGSITAASRDIAISQPAVTQGLSKIEAQLGISLFQRLPSGMQAELSARILSRRAEAALALIASNRVTMAQIRAFLALADAGSYSEAAAETGLAEPTLHRAVGDLSVALDRSLVERRGRGIALTYQGRLTARALRLARNEISAALAELAPYTGRGQERVVIGAMPLARARILPEAINRFQRLHPNVAIRIVEGAFPELVEPLRDGEVDLMIGALRTPAPSRDLLQLPLFEDQPVIFARSGHPLETNDLRALANHDWIMPERGTPLREQWIAMFASAGIEPPPVVIECGSVITIRQLLRASDALTMLSRDQLAVELTANLLKVVGPAHHGTKRTIGVTTRRDWHPTGIQRAFLDQLEHAAREMPLPLAK
jgi:LysR family transcriptional regulator, regulator for genes of the gallate degradation pathway